MNEGDPKQNEEVNNRSKRLENILSSLRNCKNDFITEREECKKVREINTKLELELKEARELEKSHRYHLLSSREMIGNLQETVSQLVYLKRNEKKMKDELIARECTISTMEKDKENLTNKQNATILELRNANEKHIEELMAINERKIQQVQNECDTRVAQFSCVIEELRSKIKDIETEHRDKLNVVVLDYEEKIQRETAQKSQLQDQLTMQAANIDAYKRKLQEIEEKLKQTQFKRYLAQGSYRSQYDNQNERPYSVTDDYQPADLGPELERPAPKTPHVNETRFQIAKTTSTYYNKELNFNDKGRNYSAYNSPNPNLNIQKSGNLNDNNHHGFNDNKQPNFNDNMGQIYNYNKELNFNGNKGPNLTYNKEPNFNDSKEPNLSYNKEPNFNDSKGPNLNYNKESNYNNNKGLKQNTLQVMYYDKPNNAPKPKKGAFNITKKRKLFNEKDFQNF